MYIVHLYMYMGTGTLGAATCSHFVLCREVVCSSVVQNVFTIIMRKWTFGALKVVLCRVVISIVYSSQRVLYLRFYINTLYTCMYSTCMHACKTSCSQMKILFLFPCICRFAWGIQEKQYSSWTNTEMFGRLSWEQTVTVSSFLFPVQWRVIGNTLTDKESSGSATSFKKVFWCNS